MSSVRGGHSGGLDGLRLRGQVGGRMGPDPPCGEAEQNARNARDDPNRRKTQVCLRGRLPLAMLAFAFVSG